MGSLSVLNVGAGDISLTFNHHDDAEAKKAVAMLQDMQRRGYAILVRDEEGIYQRAAEIDSRTGRYIIQLPPDKEPPADAEVVTCMCGCGRAVKPGKKWVKGHHHRGRAARAKGTKVSVPVAGRHAHGVARSAGG